MRATSLKKRSQHECFPVNFAKLLRIYRGLSTVLKSSKKVYEVMFLIYKSMYIMKVYSIHYTLR